MTDSGSMDPATQVIREEEKRMEKRVVDVCKHGIPLSRPWNDCEAIDQALTAAREEPVERLARMLHDQYVVSVVRRGWAGTPENFEDLARYLLAHADVLADILNQAKEVK